MNVYDFDKTILRYDSSFRFFVFCFKTYKETRRLWPRQLEQAILYAVGIIGTKTFKERLFAFVRYVPDIDTAVFRFWEGESAHIGAWYLKQKQPSDIIISASPEFLLAPIAKKLGVTTLIATRMNKTTGLIEGPNCKGEEKVRRLYQVIPNAVIDEFYSDSFSDTPLAKLANKSFLVLNGKLTDWPRNRR